jgi:hypothetical protein
MSVSLIDQMVERVLDTSLNCQEKMYHDDIPSKPGQGFSEKSVRDAYCRASFERGSKGIAESDISGYDWSMKPWEHEMDADMRVRMTWGPKEALRRFDHMIHVRCALVILAVFALEDGSLWMLSLPGIQLSGSFNTSSTNSRVRVALAYYVGARWADAQGDDAIEDPVEGARDEYELLGHPIKDYRVCLPDVDEDPSFTFCSVRFCRSGASYPVDGTKGLYNFCKLKEWDVDRVVALRHDLDGSPLWPSVLAALRLHRPVEYEKYSWLLTDEGNPQ